jgi:hypothetical protein
MDHGFFHMDIVSIVLENVTLTIGGWEMRDTSSRKFSISTTFQKPTNSKLKPRAI